MFSLEVLQNRWLILALGGGAALVLGMVLAYAALWRARPREDAGPVGPAGPHAAEEAGAARDAIGTGSASEGDAPGHETPHPPVPWFLVLTCLGIVAYAVIYVIVQALRPPNW